MPHVLSIEEAEDILLVHHRQRLRGLAQEPVGLVDVYPSDAKLVGEEAERGVARTVFQFGGEGLLVELLLPQPSAVDKCGGDAGKQEDEEDHHHRESDVPLVQGGDALVLPLRLILRLDVAYGGVLLYVEALAVVLIFQLQVFHGLLGLAHGLVEFHEEGVGLAFLGEHGIAPLLFHTLYHVHHLLLLGLRLVVAFLVEQHPCLQIVGRYASLYVVVLVTPRQSVHFQRLVDVGLHGVHHRRVVSQVVERGDVHQVEHGVDLSSFPFAHAHLRLPAHGLLEVGHKLLAQFLGGFLLVDARLVGRQHREVVVLYKLVRGPSLGQLGQPLHGLLHVVEVALVEVADAHVVEAERLLGLRSLALGEELLRADEFLQGHVQASVGLFLFGLGFQPHGVGVGIGSRGPCDKEQAERKGDKAGGRPAS